MIRFRATDDGKNAHRIVHANEAILIHFGDVTPFVIGVAIAKMTHRPVLMTLDALMVCHGEFRHQYATTFDCANCAVTLPLPEFIRMRANTGVNKKFDCSDVVAPTTVKSLVAIQSTAAGSTAVP